MATSRYRRFPYRTFFRWGFLFFFIALIPGAPLLYSMYWDDYYQKTVDTLNQSPSYRNNPGAAEAATWHIDAWWPWVLLGAVVLLLLYLPVFIWASPSRDPKKSTYD